MSGCIALTEPWPVSPANGLRAGSRKAVLHSPEQKLLFLLVYLKTYPLQAVDRKSTRLNSSHANISYAVFCLKKKKKSKILIHTTSTTITRNAIIIIKD